MKVEACSVEELRRIMQYDHETGILTWKYRPERRDCWNTRYANKPAFTASNGQGYFVGRLHGKQVKAHRAAWAIYYGEWPYLFLDHINGNGEDNRINNLRECVQAQNMRNTGMYSTNKCGFKGVYWDNKYGGWRACIVKNYKTHHLGKFSSAQEAHAAYVEASHRLHGEFGRTE